jgi:hypothetical protein
MRKLTARKIFWKAERFWQNPERFKTTGSRSGLSLIRRKPQTGNGSRPMATAVGLPGTLLVATCQSLQIPIKSNRGFGRFPDIENEKRSLFYCYFENLYYV